MTVSFRIINLLTKWSCSYEKSNYFTIVFYFVFRPPFFFFFFGEQKWFTRTQYVAHKYQIWGQKVEEEKTITKNSYFRLTKGWKRRGEDWGGWRKDYNVNFWVEKRGTARKFNFVSGTLWMVCDKKWGGIEKFNQARMRSDRKNSLKMKYQTIRFNWLINWKCTLWWRETYNKKKKDRVRKKL